MYLINKKQKLTECDKLLYIIIEHIFEFFKRIMKNNKKRAHFAVRPQLLFTCNPVFVRLFARQKFNAALN